MAWVAPRDGKTTYQQKLTECDKKVNAIENYVNRKVLLFAKNDKVDHLWDRIKKLEESNYYGEIQQLQIQVGELMRNKVFEKLATVDTVSNRLTKVEEQLGVIENFRNSADAVLRIQDYDINKLRTEVETLKKQVNELAKREHSILVKRYYYYPCR